VTTSSEHPAESLLPEETHAPRGDPVRPRPRIVEGPVSAPVADDADAYSGAPRALFPPSSTPRPCGTASRRRCS
jgi:hypothetical protein